MNIESNVINTISGLIDLIVPLQRALNAFYMNGKVEIRITGTEPGYLATLENSNGKPSLRITGDSR